EGLKALRAGKGDAFVSAGSTGALVVGSTMFVKRIKGVKRAAIASIIPTAKGRYMLLDMGANAECRPEMLAQFAIMASAYMKKACGLEDPTVGLLNIGTEDTKGDELRKETFALLKTAPVNFIGNVEARELPTGAADIVVTDGFTGNVVLKLTEGVASTLFKLIKNALYKNIINKICALIIKKDLYALKSMMDSSEVGGALLLGISAPVIKAHGNSDAKAIKHAIRAAARFAESGVISATEEGLAEFQLNGAETDAE
ncbi:MAG: phosphate acyltransferase PlsX, partial [Clostridia bacterium]|nr:phosphate acyltransferase PlsX [Clostridia bacterium]